MDVSWYQPWAMEFIYQDFISVRVTCPFHPGLLLPVQCFSAGGEIVGSVTEIRHTRVRAAPSRSQESQNTPCQAPLWFRGSLASPAPSNQLGDQPPGPPQPRTPAAMWHSPALRISGCRGKSSASYPIQPPPLQVMHTLVRKWKKIWEKLAREIKTASGSLTCTATHTVLSTLDFIILNSRTGVLFSHIKYS